MSRQTFLLGVGIGLVSVAFAVTCQLVGPVPGATEANLRRLKGIMTLREVEALFGGRGKWSWTIVCGDFYFTQYTWAGSSGRITVCFAVRVSFDDGTLRAEECGIMTVSFHPTTGTFLSRLLPWLGR